MIIVMESSRGLENGMVGCGNSVAGQISGQVEVGAAKPITDSV